MKLEPLKQIQVCSYKDGFVIFALTKSGKLMTSQDPQGGKWEHLKEVKDLKVNE